MLGELALHAGDAEAGAELLARAAEEYVAAGLPWFAVEYEARLVQVARQLGDAETAQRAARAALEHGRELLEPVGQAQLHLQAAEALGGSERFTEAAEHALEAAHWADEAGEGPTLGAWARHQLGGFLLQQGRFAEAAEVLESALPDLTGETHGDGAIVQTQWWLGDCLTELGEHRAAAERWLQAAEIARHWPEQRDHAMLAHLAAEALGQADLPTEAERAYARAADLWRELGNTHGLVRALRAGAWLAVRDEAGLDTARELMAEAARACQNASPEDDGARDRLVVELAHTYRQFGELIARSAGEDADPETIRTAFEEALTHLEEAIAVFESLGAGALDLRTGAELAAGRLEADLGRPDAAAARARAVLSAYEETDGDAETARSRRTEAERLLELLAARQDR
jgi:tetratricopeptide (TPR) repeat protein